MPEYKSMFVVCIRLALLVPALMSFLCILDDLFLDAVYLVLLVDFTNYDGFVIHANIIRSKLERKTQRSVHFFWQIHI